MSKLTEKPFEYLRTKEGNKPFPDETVKNWYVSRAYVLNAFREKELAFGPDSNEHLHAVVVGDSPLMLAVVRQLALSAHFINFVEHDINGNLACKNRTVITVVSQMEANQILGLLEKEEYLCNLLKYCKHTVFGTVRNQDSYIDIELEVVKEEPHGDNLLRITEKDVTDFVKSQQHPEKIYEIDTRKALCASSAYDLGDTINNVPYEGFFLADRYSLALNKFQYRLLEKKNSGLTLVQSKWKTNLSAVKEGLSNIFSSDCFETRRREVNLIIKDKENAYDGWKRTNLALSLSEHCRWLVEKLIMGYRPMNLQERLEYESCFGSARKAYLKKLKNNSADPVHIDICSFKELRRIDPDNMKYDSFIMLAIPWILEKIEAEDEKRKD